MLAPGNVPLLVFGGPVDPSGNTLRVIIGDREDPIYDSTVCIAGLRAVVPEPGVAGAGLAALLALGGLVKRTARDRA